MKTERLTDKRLREVIATAEDALGDDGYKNRLLDPTDCLVLQMATELLALRKELRHIKRNNPRLISKYFPRITSKH